MGMDFKNETSNLLITCDINISGFTLFSWVKTTAVTVF
jgi:hypothetical protein